MLCVQMEKSNSRSGSRQLCISLWKSVRLEISRRLLCAGHPSCLFVLSCQRSLSFFCCCCSVLPYFTLPPPFFVCLFFKVWFVPALVLLLELVLEPLLLFLTCIIIFLLLCILFCLLMCINCVLPCQKNFFFTVILTIAQQYETRLIGI